MRKSGLLGAPEDLGAVHIASCQIAEGSTSAVLVLGELVASGSGRGVSRDGGSEDLGDDPARDTLTLFAGTRYVAEGAPSRAIWRGRTWLREAQRLATPAA